MDTADAQLLRRTACKRGNENIILNFKKDDRLFMTHMHVVIGTHSD